MAPDPTAPARPDNERVAHELSNLLDGSLRNLSLAIQRVSDGGAAAPEAGADDVLRRLETASHGLRQMAVLVRQWMSESPAEQSSEHAAARESDESLRDAISLTVDLLAPMAAQHGVSIEFACDDAAAALPAGRIIHVVANAVRNSIETIAAAGGAGGCVKVEAHVDGGACELTVTDDGPGFDRGMFDEWEGFRFGRTTRPGGHGIGLTVARDVAERLNGTLDVYNREQGGAVVRMRFPAARRGERPAARIVPVR